MNQNNQQIKSTLADITNPLSFESVSQLVRQVEGLSNIRDHQNINNQYEVN